MKVMLTLDGSKAHIELDANEGFRLFGALGELYKQYAADFEKYAKYVPMPRGPFDDPEDKEPEEYFSTDEIARNIEDLAFVTGELSMLSAMMFAMTGDHNGKPRQNQAKAFFVEGFGLHREGEGVNGG
jgi:hypothetical protein